MLFIFCIVQDTDSLLEQMTGMCVNLREKYAQRSIATVGPGGGTKPEPGSTGSKRACSACHIYGHRSDNANCPAKRKGFLNPQASTAPVQNEEPVVAGAPLIFNSSAVIDAFIVQNDQIVVAGAPPIYDEAPTAPVQNEEPVVAGAPLIFNSSAVIDAFIEKKAEFAVRLLASNLTAHKVPPSGACFWTASFKGLNWLCDRNSFYANSISRPATADAMRQHVLDFILQNLDVHWAQKDVFLGAVSNFSTMINDEIPFGVCNGSTGLTAYPNSIDEWFVLMRHQYAYSSAVCVWATALCFRVALKVFIKGCATEAYVPRRELEQDSKELNIIHPDSTICLCKDDRGGHFDACHYAHPVMFVPNGQTKQGQGRLRQARLKSAVELAKNKGKGNRRGANKEQK
jgi:hypothetical protein